MKIKTKTNLVFCDLCEVECKGEGFFIAPIKSEFITLAVRQCPACMRLVPVVQDRYLSVKKRKFLAKINGESEECAA